MWNYYKQLEYPVKIKTPNPRLAKFIISQYGGPDGELAASLRYLSQRFGMPDQKSKAILNDIRNRGMCSAKMSFIFVCNTPLCIKINISIGINAKENNINTHTVVKSFW